MIMPRILLAPLCMAIAMQLAGCSLQPAVSPPSMEIQWPPAPQAARIKYLYEIRNPRDLAVDRGMLRQLIRSLKGEGPKQIVRPYGVAVANDSTIFVVDNAYQAIHVFDRKENEYRRFPKQPDREFINPVNIALGRDGRIFVSDSASGNIHVFDQKGKRHLRSFGSEYLERPTGLVVNPVTAELLVLDTRASKLFCFDADSLTLKRVIGSEESPGDRTLFHYPTNIAVSQEGNVYISDSLNFQIRMFSPELDLLASFGTPGNTPGTFSRPKGLAVDSDHHVYVIDAIFDNVQVFSPTGELLIAFGGPGNQAGRFWLPNAIFIDEQDHIYVSDAYNQRIQVFEYIRQSAQR